jgi:short subunit fatty acids transporter
VRCMAIIWYKVPMPLATAVLMLPVLTTLALSVVATRQSQVCNSSCMVYADSIPLQQSCTAPLTASLIVSAALCTLNTYYMYRDDEQKRQDEKDKALFRSYQKVLKKQQAAEEKALKDKIKRKAEEQRRNAGSAYLMPW